jgi:molecular chaperone DnaK
VEDLQRASQAMAEHLYAANAEPGPGAAPGGDGASATDGAAGGKPADDVIDVEFEEK